MKYGNTGTSDYLFKIISSGVDKVSWQAQTILLFTKNIFGMRFEHTNCILLLAN